MPLKYKQLAALTPAKRLIVIAAAITLTATAGIFGYRHLTQARLSSMIKADLPMLDLTVVMRDLDNQDLSAAATLLGSDDPTPSTADANCPTLSGGDIGDTSVASNIKRPAECPRSAVWYVKKHPIAFTLYFNQGQKFLTWWDKQPQVQNLLNNRFMQGLFYGLLQSLKVKAEQLQLQGIQGEFLAHLLRDAIAANAELHYDLVHGKEGWVLSYLRRDSDFAEQALPAMAGLLAQSGYRLAKLPEPILELRVGLQHFFLTEYQQRLYLAQSLEALLNVLESLSPQKNAAAAPFSLTIRAEAFIENILPVLAGAPTWQTQFNFTLQDEQLGEVRLPTGPWSKTLHDKLFSGVLASIPQDAFAAVAGSFQLPPNLTSEDWRTFADAGPTQSPPGPEPGGLAVVWDYDSNSPAGAIGLIVANPAAPQASQSYSQYLRNADKSAECAGGSIFLAASSEGLLTRMKEACAQQSLSMLDWQRGRDKQHFEASQLVAFINPGVGLRELFLAGGAAGNADRNEFAPQWQQDYETAKAAMVKDGDKLFTSLPIFSYAGRINGEAATINLEGRTVSQELAK
jgi:hypothetical protein